MLRTKAFWSIAVLAAIAMFASPSTANADFRMRVERIGVDGVVVTDQGSGDTNANVGTMLVSATLAGGVTTTITVGLQQPPAPGLPASAFAGLDLNGVVVHASGAGVVRLSLQATGYSGGPDGPINVDHAVGGTASGTSSVSFRSWANGSNLVEAYGPDTFPAGALAAKSALPAGTAGGTPLTFLGAGAFSGTNSYGFTKSGFYSLFVEAIISFTGSGTVTFDESTLTNPEPATIAAALTGLPFLAGFMWRRRKSVSLSA